MKTKARRGMLKNQRAIANSSLFGSLFNFDFKNLFVLSMLSSVVNKNGKPKNRKEVRSFLGMVNFNRDI